MTCSIQLQWQKRLEIASLTLKMIRKMTTFE